MIDERNRIRGSKRMLVFLMDRLVCAYCGLHIIATPQVDHIIPRVKGGSDDEHNLVTCCHVCNARKGDKAIRHVFGELVEHQVLAHVQSRLATPGLVHQARAIAQHVSKTAEQMTEIRNHLQASYLLD